MRSTVATCKGPCTCPDVPLFPLLVSQVQSGRDRQHDADRIRRGRVCHGGTQSGDEGIDHPAVRTLLRGEVGSRKG